MMPEDEATLLEKVWNDHYKQEDWDKEHYIPPKKINSTNPHHALVRREHATFIPPRPNKSAQCGFRTVVKLEDYYALLCMADHLPITVKPVIESGLVEPEELDEMLAYRVYRNIAKVERERKKEVAKQAARTAEQEREKQACTVAGERLNNHPITVLERRSRLWHVHPSTTWNCGGTGRDTTYFVSGHGDVKSVQDVEGIIESEESSVKSLEEMMGCKPT
ncbi:hypothetical protein K469DRAFT_704763 [Zopfia rhizophila CBS 207.26]|uniref:Uncharacterized protein n=1 Tax=Zopfia rhizophila CBS 207.26 TaxID=1314779 RepID=A0A6A6EDB6_9PEZI|nr:hypothetical protein K469DRAFT_704763 [Zopfia rhizophila CBS 207.26]